MRKTPCRPLIANKGKPASCRLRVSRRSFHPAGNRSFRDIETEHEKVAVNTWGAPGGVLRHHPKDQIADFLGNPSPANDPVASGNCPPIDCKPRSLPTATVSWLTVMRACFHPDHNFRAQNSFIERSAL